MTKQEINLVTTPTKENPRGGKPLGRAKAIEQSINNTGYGMDFSDVLAIPVSIQKWASDNGYHLQWMRFSSKGVIDHQKLEVLARRGYAPVLLEEIPGSDTFHINNPFTSRLSPEAVKASLSTSLPGMITQKDLVLCKIPVEIREQHRLNSIRLAEGLHEADRKKLQEANDLMSGGGIRNLGVEETYTT